MALLPQTLLATIRLPNDAIRGQLPAIRATVDMQLHSFEKGLAFVARHPAAWKTYGPGHDPVSLGPPSITGFYPPITVSRSGGAEVQRAKSAHHLVTFREI